MWQSELWKGCEGGHSNAHPSSHRGDSTIIALAPYGHEGIHMKKITVVLSALAVSLSLSAFAQDAGSSSSGQQGSSTQTSPQGSTSGQTGAYGTSQGQGTVSTDTSPSMDTGKDASQ